MYLEINVRGDSFFWGGGVEGLFVDKEEILIAVPERATPCSDYSAPVEFNQPKFERGQKDSATLSTAQMHTTHLCAIKSRLFSACQRHFACLLVI